MSMKNVYLKSFDHILGEASLEEAFPFLRKRQPGERKHIVSLVGAGGKTTLLYELAEVCKENGMKTLVTTTTHLQRPKDSVWAHSLSDAETLWKQGEYVVVGEACKQEKICAPEPTALYAYMNAADIVLIEADGAKRMPCKVPNLTEPVIVSECDIVIGVMGMDAIGKPLSEVCFRLSEAMELLGVTKEHRLTAKDAAKILQSERGTRKDVGNRDYYVVLNKCDDEARVEVAGAICRELGGNDE